MTPEIDFDELNATMIAETGLPIAKIASNDPAVIRAFRKWKKAAASARLPETTTVATEPAMVTRVRLRQIPEPKNGVQIRCRMEPDHADALTKRAMTGSMSASSFARTALAMLAEGRTIGPKDVFAEAQRQIEVMAGLRRPRGTVGRPKKS